LLYARLEKHRHAAYRACAALLAEHSISAVLVDVEHLFDGQGLFFYFLGDVPPAKLALFFLRFSLHGQNRYRIREKDSW
jgi:hypothetical protein